MSDPRFAPSQLPACANSFGRTPRIPRRRAVRWVALLMSLLAIPQAARSAGDSFDGAWTHLVQGGPPPHRDAGAVYDVVRDRLVVIGGDGGTWVLPLNASPVWTRIQGPTYQGTGFERAVYDPAGDRMIVVSSAMTVFALSMASPTAWQQISAAGVAPPPRSFFAVARDAARNRLIVYGGGPSPTFNDVWVLNLSGSPTWTQLQPTGTAPAPTWGPLAVYDEDRDQLIVGTGASDLGYTTTSALFALNLSGTPSWTALTPGGPTPPPRMLSSAVYDRFGQRLVMFSGYPTGNADTWALELLPTPQWVLLAPGGTAPPYQWSSAAVYRSQVPGLVLYGGHNGADFTDTWSLSLTLGSGPPLIDAFSPFGGRVGDAVSIFGNRLAGATSVTFNGTSAAILSSSFSLVQTQVPAGATTGPISVTTPDGTVTSTALFVVGEPPVLTSVEPDSGRTGDVVLVRGQHLDATTAVHFGGTGSAAFVIASDTALSVTVDSLASSGTITAESQVGPGTSSFVFTKLEDDPRPRLLSVKDVAGDQGGKVLLRWRASDFDQVRYKRITGYRVWRRAPASQAPAANQPLPQGWIATRGPDATTGDPTEFWENLAQLPASYLRGYAYAAATLRDSSDVDNPYTAYFVQAITADPFVFYNSSPDSGYSVDNLAPPAPAPFAIQYAPGANTLRWHLRSVPDLRGFEVYRGTSAAFMPSAANRIAATADTSLVDAPGAAFYKLAAVDRDGNRSRYASASPDLPVASLASFIQAQRSTGAVHVVWLSGGNAGMPASVYRRTEVSDWQLQQVIAADASGFLAYDDHAADDRARYAYRLGVLEPDGIESVLADTWVDPLTAAFAFMRPAANPSPAGRIALAFSLPFSAGADVRLYDVSGRLIERRNLPASDAAVHSVEFGTQARLRAGLYLVRATSGAAVLLQRVVVLN